MSSIEDILAGMKKSAPPAAAPPSHSWAEPAAPEPAPTKPPPLDGVHHVAGGEALDFRFRSGAVNLSESEAAALRSDCNVAFALNSSNWLAASAEPRCSLEAVARAVFERHTRGATYDATRSGCEWWAQARTRGSHRP